MSTNSSFTTIQSSKVATQNLKLVGDYLVPTSIPDASFLSEYDMIWNRHTTNFHKYNLVGVQENKQVGGYETTFGKQVFGIQIGANHSSVIEKYGNPLSYIKKKNTIYRMNDTSKDGAIQYGTYLIDNWYVTFFYDIYKFNIVRSIIWVATNIEQSKAGYYASSSNTLRESFEDLMVELINQSRVTEGLQPLIYEKCNNKIARSHSLNMINNNFFSHQDHHGRHSNDRMQSAGLSFHWYGENIAYGQYSSIYAHEALMNSLSHRVNILRKEFTHVFVGVHFKNNTPYYTINFYSKF